MPRRMTPAQFQSHLQQLQRQQQRAIDEYNREVRRVNDHNRRVVEDYNRQARAHNQRLRDEVNRLTRMSTRRTVTVRWTVRRQSALSLHQSFTRLEQSGYEHRSPATARLFDLAGAEATNSAAVVNVFADPEQGTDRTVTALQQTSITDELRDISADLDSRWRGALYALSPENPDAARHFCTSGRELFTEILNHYAPDDSVKESKVDYIPTDHGGVSRRAKIMYCLERSGRASDEIVAFADDDIQDIIDLFKDFNPATHGHAGRYTLAQLAVLKSRVEQGIKFLHEITAGSVGRA